MHLQPSIFSVFLSIWSIKVRETGSRGDAAPSYLSSGTGYNLALISMSEENYGARVRRLLAGSGASVFDRVLVETSDGVKLEGIVMPRPEVGDPDVLVIKMENGYNVGIHVSRIRLLRVTGRREPAPLVELSLPRGVENLPKVFFIGTGGTIASRIDYKTGAVYPFFSAEEIYSMIPELEEIAYIKAETLFSIFSEDMTPGHWERLAREIESIYRREAPAGVVVAHGTDTMHYSAAAMGFAVREAPGPIVFVGAQRSSDRPSSDSAFNVIGATVTAIEAPFAESVIAMHGSVSDDYILVHRGVKARKMHTSRRDAFMSINALPLAEVEIPSRRFRVISKRYRRRSDDIVVEPRFSDRAALLKYYPGMPAEHLDWLVERGYRGIVLEGTGLGHVGSHLVESVRRAVRDGVLVAMASQCIWGRINMNVYRTGVELLRAGAMPAGDMTPETAYVKMSWVLGQAEDVEEARRLFLANTAYEYEERSEYRFYPGAGWWR